MCVIGYAPKNVTIDDSTVKIMFENNPDGAGIMWKPPGKPVEIRKGFFDVKELLKAWHKIPIECEKAIHCRIATAGKVTAQCCHPFPVRECTRAMKSKADCSDVVFMHNGIITLTDPPAGIKSPFSDSMMFGKEILYPLKNSLDNTYVQQMLEDSIDGSRMLIFRQYGDTVRLGTWVSDGKLWFSNSSYKKNYHTYANYNSCYGNYSYPAAKAVAVPAKVTTTVPTVAEAKQDDSPLNSFTKQEDNYQGAEFLFYAVCEKAISFSDLTTDEADQVVDYFLDNGEYLYPDELAAFMEASRGFVSKDITTKALFNIATAGYVDAEDLDMRDVCAVAELMYEKWNELSETQQKYATPFIDEYLSEQTYIYDTAEKVLNGTTEVSDLPQCTREQLADYFVKNWSTLNADHKVFLMGAFGIKVDEETKEGENNGTES